MHPVQPSPLLQERAPGRTRRSLIRRALAAVVVLAVTACGSDGGDDTAGTTPAGSDAPQAIISLSPSATEMLFAIGAGEQVIAVDEYSDFPAEALAKQSKLSGFTPNVEAIAAYKPDLVVIGDDTNGLVASLGRLGIDVWSGPAPTTFDELYEQLIDLGRTTGHAESATTLAGQMKGRIAAAVASAPKLSSPPTYFHELGTDLYTVGSSTFVGQTYALFGLRNVADAVHPGTAYPQFSAEALIAADPEMIFLADSQCCGQNQATVAARPGWAAISAVRNGMVVELDEDVASRWGPRVVDYVEAVAAAVTSLAAVRT